MLACVASKDSAHHNAIASGWDKGPAFQLLNGSLSVFYHRLWRNYVERTELKSTLTSWVAPTSSQVWRTISTAAKSRTI